MNVPPRAKARAVFSSVWAEAVMAGTRTIKSAKSQPNHDRRLACFVIENSPFTNFDLSCEASKSTPLELRLQPGRALQLLVLERGIYVQSSSSACLCQAE